MDSFEQWRGTLPATKLIQTGNCCRMSYEAGQESRQAEIDDLKAQLAKIQAVPDGFVRMPIEPTYEILCEVARAVCSRSGSAERIYRAMIKAAQELENE